MKKWKKVVLWLLSITLVLAIGGLFAANYAADRLIASLAASLESELLELDLTEPDQNGGSQVDTGNDNASTDGTNVTSPSNETAVGQNGSEGNGSSTNNSKGNGSDQPTPTPYRAEVSTDKAKEVQEKITVSEKAKLTSVFLKQLSMDDIKTLQSLASGGLSKEEKKEARNLIVDRLSPEQYDELIQIAKKYGLSKGKSYAEVSGK